MKTSSGLYYEAQGSVGSITARNSLGGTSFINRRKQNKKTTPTQTIIREAIKEAPNLFFSNTPDYQRAWQDQAESRPKYRANGDAYYWSGLLSFTDCHVKHVLYKSILNGYLVLNPTARGNGVNRDFTLVNDAVNKQIKIIDNTLNGADIFIANSKELRATRNKYTGSYFNHRDIHFVGNNNNTIYNYTVSGKRIFFKVIAHNRRDRIDTTQILTTIT